MTHTRQRLRLLSRQASCLCVLLFLFGCSQPGALSSGQKYNAIEADNKALSELREDDYIVRWGGEEFLIVSRTANREDSNFIASRLCQKVRETDFSDQIGDNIAITCSIGYTLFPLFTKEPNFLNWEELVEIADKALYAVKQNGRNGWATFKTSSDTPYYSIKNCKNFDEFKEKNRLELILHNDGHEKDGSFLQQG